MAIVIKIDVQTSVVVARSGFEIPRAHVLGDVDDDVAVGVLNAGCLLGFLLFELGLFMEGTEAVGTLHIRLTRLFEKLFALLRSLSVLHTRKLL